MGLWRLRLQRQPFWSFFLVFLLALVLLGALAANAFTGIRDTTKARSSNSNVLSNFSLSSIPLTVFAEDAIPDTAAPSATLPNGQVVGTPAETEVTFQANSSQGLAASPLGAIQSNGTTRESHSASPPQESLPEQAATSSTSQPLSNAAIAPAVVRVASAGALAPFLAYAQPTRGAQASSVGAVPPVPADAQATQGLQAHSAGSVTPSPRGGQSIQDSQAPAGSLDPTSAYPQPTQTTPSIGYSSLTPLTASPFAHSVNTPTATAGETPVAASAQPSPSVQKTHDLQTLEWAPLAGQQIVAVDAPRWSTSSLVPPSASEPRGTLSAKVLEEPQPECSERGNTNAWIFLLILSIVAVLALIGALICLYTVCGRHMRTEKISRADSTTERTRVPRHFDQSSFAQDHEFRSKSMRSPSVLYNQGPRTYGSSPALSSRENSRPLSPVTKV